MIKPIRTPIIDLDKPYYICSCCGKDWNNDCDCNIEIEKKNRCDSLTQIRVAILSEILNQMKNCKTLKHKEIILSHIDLWCLQLESLIKNIVEDLD